MSEGRGFKPVGVPENLTKLAKKLPTQSVQAANVAEKEVELRVQLTMKVRKSLRDELRQKALENGMTLQAFVMEALKDKGLDIIDDDLKDLRSR